MALYGDDDDIDDDDFDGDGFDPDAVEMADKNLLIQLLMNQQVSAGIPITNRLFNKYKTQNYNISCVELQGYRDTMEDKHLIYFNLCNNPNISIFGVFDGHGGDLTSKYIEKTLINILENNIINNTFDDKSLINCIKLLDQKWTQFELKRKKLKDFKLKQYEKKINKQALKFTLDDDDDTPLPDIDNNDENEIKDIEFDNDEKELNNDIETIDDNNNNENNSHPMMSMTTNEFGSVGSTLVCSIIEYNKEDNNYKITTINLGDSRAILLKNITQEEEEKGNEYKLIELTSDHKPNNAEERQRIIRAGGEVKYNRVDGDLALSRAIGDTKYKQNKLLSVEEQKISCIPSITRQIGNIGDYLMIYCDGIVEYKSNNDVFKFMSNALNKMKLNKGKRDNNLEGKLCDISICNHLREAEINYLNNSEILGLIPKHNIELIDLDKILLNLTDWALESGSKDNMTAMIIEIGKNKDVISTEYKRIWCPCEFYQNKIQFNNIGDEITDKEHHTLDRFMRLFEADCSCIGWDMSIKYENGLLQKILYINDLITNCKQKYDIKKLIQMQNNKLLKLEQGEIKRKGKKRKSMDEDEDDNNNNNIGNGNDNESPRKRRKLDQ